MRDSVGGSGPMRCRKNISRFKREPRKVHSVSQEPAIHLCTAAIGEGISLFYYIVMINAQFNRSFRVFEDSMIGICRLSDGYDGVD